MNPGHFFGLGRFYREVDHLALAAIVGLLLLSSVTLFSITHAGVPENALRGMEVGTSIFYRQLVFVGLGFIALLVGFSMPFRLLEGSAWLQYALIMTLLSIVLLMPNRAGVERWIIIGPLQFQPSELAKVAIIFVMARYLASIKGDINHLRHMIPAFLIILPPVALIVKQPNLGTALVFFAILIPMMYWRGLRMTHLVLLGSPVMAFLLHLYLRTQHPGLWWIWIVVIVLVSTFTFWRRLYLIENIVISGFNVAIHWIDPYLWSHLKDYQQRRILTFFQPEFDRLGDGYHVVQSKIAVGSGGFLGKGFMEGTQKELAFLPERHTDFIFSVIGEEFGFIGALIVLSLFAVLMFRGISFASRARNGFVRYSAFGIVAYLLFQVTQNIGMTMGLFPVAGIPLPMVSYGGSSLLVTLFLMGVLLNLGTRWREY